MLVPNWIAPLPKESLNSYARRLAQAVHPGRPCFIGGASFGGIIALEMIPHLDVLGCFLVGSVQSSRELPSSITNLRSIARLADVLPFEILQGMSRLFLLSCGEDETLTKSLLQQMSVSDASFLRWACRAILEWDGPATSPTCPIHHIHGEKDFVLPVKNTHPDHIIPGAGHALSISHPDEVTEFMKVRVQERIGPIIDS